MIIDSQSHRLKCLIAGLLGAWALPQLMVRQFITDPFYLIFPLLATVVAYLAGLPLLLPETARWWRRHRWINAAILVAAPLLMIIFVMHLPAGKVDDSEWPFSRRTSNLILFSLYVLFIFSIVHWPPKLPTATEECS